MLYKHDYIKKDISRMTGLAPRLIQFYVDQGVVEPQVYRGSKRGDHHKYSTWNVFEFALIKQLRNYGVSLGAVREIIRMVNEEFPGFDDVREHYLVIRGEVDAKGHHDYWVAIAPFLSKEGIMPGIPLDFFDKQVSAIVIDLRALYKRVFPDEIPKG